MANVRKHPAHPPTVDRFNTPIIVYLTVCSQDRKPILAAPDAANAIIQAWLVARSWAVGRYLIMPDHIHLFSAPATFPVEPLDQWIRYWKTAASKRWPRPSEQPIWQRDFWDTQLRRTDNYDAKWQYLTDNPVRAGLVARSEEWTFQGELNVLHW